MNYMASENLKMHRLNKLSKKLRRNEGNYEKRSGNI